MESSVQASVKAVYYFSSFHLELSFRLSDPVFASTRNINKNEFFFRMINISILAKSAFISPNLLFRKKKVFNSRESFDKMF